MKIITFLSLYLAFCLTVTAQKSKQEPTSFYAFNENAEPCKIEDAKYLGILERIADTAWQWKYYHFTGPLISVETYSEKEMTFPHGYFAWYDANGTIDSSGYTYKGKKDRTWYYYSDSLTIWQSETYNRGILIKRMDEAALKAEREDQRNTIDTTSFQLVEKEAAFKGDDKAWIRYLEKNLQFPGRAMQLDKQGKVVISFVVDKDGSTRDIFLSQSVEYSLDEEALRLVRQSPRWEPAIQNGRTVNAYRRQPITFAFR